MIFWGKAFWRSYAISLRRSGRDKRARIFAAQVTAGILYALAYIGYIFILPFRQQGGGWLLAFYGFIFGTGTIAFLALRRSHAREQESLTFSLTGSARSTVTHSRNVSPAVERYLAQRAAILSCLVGRAASEIRTSIEQPEDSARQTFNSWLRENGLWDSLEPPEASLMSARSGTWNERERDSVVAWCDQLRLLRWVLGIDSELVPLEHFPRPGLRLIEGFHEMPKAIGANVEPWDVRVERDKASEYEMRLLAELSARRLIPPNAELDTWAGEVRCKFADDSSDYLAGAQTISDLDEAALRLLATTAITRVRYGTWLIEQLNTETPTSFARWNGTLVN